MKKVSLLFMFLVISLFGFFAGASTSTTIQEEVPGATREPGTDVTTAASGECAFEDQRCIKNFSPEQLTSDSGHSRRARVQRTLGNTVEKIDPSTGKPVGI